MRGTFLGVPHNKDYNILGSILGSPYLGKLPYSPCIIPIPYMAAGLDWTTPLPAC